MKYTALLLLMLTGSLGLSAQKVFFKSNQNFTESQLESFYSSLTIKDSLLLFNANDYHLYAYNKSTGALQWQQRINRKSDIAPFWVNGTIWVNAKDEVQQLDAATGAVKKATPIARMDTPPTIINGVLYSTGIYDAGSLFAYDLKADTVLWSRFIAHGISQTPYYLPNQIIANAEGNNWMEVGYNGKLLNAACEGEEVEYPSELSCVKKFLLRTHDGLEIKDKLAQKIGENYNGVEQLFYTAQNTFIINNSQLFVLGNKAKLLLQKDLADLSSELETDYESKVQILQADKETVWLHLGNYVLQYNFAKKKAVRTINLEEWAPHQVLLDNNQLWLISTNDGLLYGLHID